MSLPYNSKKSIVDYFINWDYNPWRPGLIVNWLSDKPGYRNSFYWRHALGMDNPIVDELRVLASQVLDE